MSDDRSSCGCEGSAMVEESRDEVATPAVYSPLAWLAIFVVRFYQTLISPMLPASCRYSPTCSQYTLIALRRYGFFRGAWMGLRRIMRCHPFHPGGHDPVP